tara:strand:- start:2384 stop:2701 length:318 start_codon:yes stop_codon:yes gene_type:complete
MNPLLVRSIKDVCRDRARISADKKYDPIILKLREEYSTTRNTKTMQEIIKASREKTKFEEEAFLYHMENYSYAEDSIPERISQEDREAYGFKKFSDYLSEELMKI